MKADDLIKPGAVVLGMAAAAALGFAAGYLMARDPQLLRRLMRSAAGGFERLAGAVAESREELADLWAESREGARDAIEDESFAAAAATAAVAAARDAAGKTSVPAVAVPAAPAKRSRKSSAKAHVAGTRVGAARRNAATSAK
jgi:hypothetical protein